MRANSPLTKNLTILIGHWIDHNKSHQETYELLGRQGRRGESAGNVAALLKEISEGLPTLITLKLEKALHAIRH